VTEDPTAVRRLTVEADLHLDLGGRSARLTGSGRELTLQLSDPADALTHVGAALLPRAGRLTPRRVGMLADRLRAAGLRLAVRGPGGPLLVLGQEGPGPLGWLTRSPYVAPGRPLALARVVAAVVLRRLRRRSRPD
jgi:hypothetical protein